MFRRNRIYTDITLGKSLLVLVGQKIALPITIYGKQVIQKNTNFNHSGALQRHFLLPSHNDMDHPPDA